MVPERPDPIIIIIILSLLGEDIGWDDGRQWTKVPFGFLFEPWLWSQTWLRHLFYMAVAVKGSKGEQVFS